MSEIAVSELCNIKIADHTFVKAILIKDDSTKFFYIENVLTNEAYINTLTKDNKLNYIKDDEDFNKCLEALKSANLINHSNIIDE